MMSWGLSMNARVVIWTQVCLQNHCCKYSFMLKKYWVRAIFSCATFARYQSEQFLKEKDKKTLLAFPKLGKPENKLQNSTSRIKLWYIDTMECYSVIKRNAFEWVLMRWMNLEPIIQSEVSQKKKDKYHILTYIYMESRKIVLKNLFTGQQWRNRHRE